MKEENSFSTALFKAEYQYQEIMKYWQANRKDVLEPQYLRDILDCVVDDFLMDIEIRDSKVYWDPYRAKIILDPEEGFTAEYVAHVIELYRRGVVKTYGLETFEMPAKPEILFPENISPTQVVKITLGILRAYHERELEKLNQVLTSYPNLLVQSLAETWQWVLSLENNQEKALATFTQIVAAELDGGDSPAIPE